MNRNYINKQNTSIAFGVLGILLTVLATFYAKRLSNRADHKVSSIIYAMKDYELPRITAFPSFFYLGGNVFNASPNNSVNFLPLEFIVDSDGRILLQGTIKGRNNEVILSAKEGEIRIVNGNKYDINFDEKAYEVVDNNMQPIFQLLVLNRTQFTDLLAEELDVNKSNLSNSNRFSGEKYRFMKDVMSENFSQVIIVYLVTRIGPRWNIISPLGIQFTPSEKDLDGARRVLKRIFEYPGVRNHGVRLN